MNNDRKVAVCVAAFALAAMAGVSFADDVVGVMSVDVGTNGLAEVEMPFSPLCPGQGPIGYVAGAFLGDGGELSDRLVRFDADSATSTNAVWDGDRWLDPATGIPSLMTAKPGDTLFLLRYDADPFGLYAFGRAASHLAPLSPPYFSSLFVDSTNATVSLGVSAATLPYDILSADSTNAVAPGTGWLHLGRSASDCIWFDDAPPAGFVRRYLVSDATRDTDGDGLSDALEIHVYGTSPFLADTDGDGIPDGREVAWGLDPLSAGASSPFFWFEGFERPAVVPGPIDGRNGWSVKGDAVADVQEGFAFEGAAALGINASEEGSPEVSCDVLAEADEIWLDMRMLQMARDDFDPGSDELMAFAVTVNGIVATDGAAVRTNAAVRIVDEAWTRLTCRLDFRTRRYDLYVDGIIVFNGLAMKGDSPRLSQISFCEGGGTLDAVSLTTERPLGLSSDGDALPDEWEFAAFGSLGRDGSGDFDSDGLPDLAEFRAGTDPLSPDTDGDGMPDAWEAAHGFDPLDAADSTLDADGDGLSNVLEFALGTDPAFFEPDPRLAVPGLRAEFRLAPVGIAEMPVFSSLEPFAVSIAETVDYADGTWPTAVERRADAFACRLSGFIRIPASGSYTFFVTADDGVELFVDGRLVVSDPLPHSARERSGTIVLTAGWHPVELAYYEQAGQAVLSLAWNGPGFAKGPVPVSALAHCPSNLAPLASLAVSPGPYVEGGEIVLSASATDVDGTVRSVAFYDGDTLLCVAQRGNASYTVQYSAPGPHSFRAVATDAEGAVGESAAVEIFVETMPAGFASGLDVSYFQLASAVSALPDFSVLDPVATDVVDIISFPATALAWDGAPSSLTDHFAAAFTGALMVREAGFYRLSLRSDDGSRLYIDGALVVDNDGDHSMTTLSASLPLFAGLHDLRVEYYENAGEAGLELSWKRPDGVSEVIAPTSLFRQVGVTDSDGDGMPDWWEERHGLDPADASDAALDPDGDGLPNLAEFRAGTNPHSPDTDCDGMPDAWETANGTIPFLADAMEDPDGDGLINIEEFRYGTNPNLADTDGDGVQDGDERNMYFSDPTMPDFNGIVVTNATIPVVSADGAFGDWVACDGCVSLLGRSGTIFYTNDLVLADAGVRQLRLSCGFAGKYDTELVCKVDGVLSGVARLRASSVVQPAEAVFLTQWLNPGQHEMSFELQNFANESEFSLFDIAVCEPQGPDSDSDGIPDWMDARMRNSSVWRPGNVASKVSPYCLRGDSASEVLPSVSTSGGGLSVGRLPYHGWYADVPLSTSGGTVVSVSYENGMKQEAVAVDWAEFDVTSEEDTVIRQGDSLLLSLGGASGTIEVDGMAVSFDGSAVSYRFDGCGDHMVTGRTGDTVRTVLVRVVTCSLPDSIPLWRGKTSTVGLSGFGFSDMYLSLGQDAALASAIISENGCTISLAVPAFGRPTALSCEIENPDASVVASAETLPFSVHYTMDGVYHVSHRLDAGTRVVENRLTAFGLPPGVELRMTGNSGICFEDGSGVLSLDCGDFDETGDCLYRFLVPEGVSNPCQFLHVYFDGKEFAQ